MSKKKCSKCWNHNVKKDGKKRWKQRYKCIICGYVFQNRTHKVSWGQLWEEYTQWKQTYRQLSERHWLSIPTIQKRIDSVIVKKKS